MEKAASCCVLHGDADVLARQEDLLHATWTMCFHQTRPEHMRYTDMEDHLELDDMWMSQLGVIQDLCLHILVDSAALQELSAIVSAN